MHFLNLVNILPSFDNIEVEFTPASGCSKFGTWKICKRREVQMIKSKENSIDKEECSEAYGEISTSARSRYLHQYLCAMYHSRCLGYSTKYLGIIKRDLKEKSDSSPRKCRMSGIVLSRCVPNLYKLADLNSDFVDQVSED